MKRSKLKSALATAALCGAALICGPAVNAGRISCRVQTALSLVCRAARGSLTIVPGRSIGQTYLGELRAEVLQRLGKPAISDPPRANGVSDDNWQSAGSVSNVMVTDRAGKVIEIGTDSDAFKTADRLSILSSLRQLRRRFRHLHERTHASAMAGQTITDFSDPVAGLAVQATDYHSDPFRRGFDWLEVFQPGRKITPDSF